MTSEAVPRVGLVLEDCNIVKSADFNGVILESVVKVSIRVKLGSEATDSAELHEVTLNKSLNSKSVDTWREATACAASAEAASSISLEDVRKVVVESGRVGLGLSIFTEVSILR